MVQIHDMDRWNHVEVYKRTRKRRVLLTDSEKLFALIPPKSTGVSLLWYDNSFVDKFQGSTIWMDFWSRDERDGIKATFAFRGGKWHFLRSKYWRDPDWDGVRQF